ncbi:hypothetical protein F8M41_008844 [Gigaspora margarita]|uniref:Uncharacterized protein n=1 Tax=Gigaspora margarita TaxID=4874 RepID=A0A8H4EQT2_GIGMA|nr:hypothetical protein F8M41_008844 [Gigaspora margarita]
MLNAEKQALLIPFKIVLPNHPKPLFKYTSYITSVNCYLSEGVRNWYRNESHYILQELEYAVEGSLICMFLRTSKNLKFLSLNVIICNQIIFKNLNGNTVVISVDLYNINSGFKYKVIDGLVKFLNKNSTLTSLNLRLIQLGYEEVKILLEALYENTVLNSLNLDE